MEETGIERHWREEGYKFRDAEISRMVALRVKLGDDLIELERLESKYTNPNPLASMMQSQNMANYGLGILAQSLIGGSLLGGYQNGKNLW